MEWVKYVVAILSGLATAIPLVIKLVEYVRIAIKEQNWNNLIKLTMGYMATAEKKFSDGATRKEWVMAMVRSSAHTINYDMDEASVAKLSDMIDSICDVAKIINVDAELCEDSGEAKEPEKVGA